VFVFQIVSLWFPFIPVLIVYYLSICHQYVEYKVQLNLKSCCLSLVNYSKKILQVTVTQMLGSWETRPAGNAYRYDTQK